MSSADRPQPVFYYDLGSPACYLAAERVNSTLPMVPEWEAVPAGALGLPAPELDRDAIARHAEELALQPLRWPPTWPPDTRIATLAATYAKRAGRAVAFSLAAFRQAFAAGRDLSELDTVLIAAAACEMHPTAVIKGISLRSTAGALAGACERARSAGVRALPSIQVGDQLFESVERAAQAFGALK